jgi:hypothetical protein
MIFQAAAMMTAPKGTLTKNTARQPRPREIKSDQDAAEQEACGAGQPEHDAVDTEGTGARGIREQQMNGGKHLRHHQRRRRALRQPRCDQFRAGLRQPTPQRGDGEARDA